jgi:hypothetical protein
MVDLSHQVQAVEFLLGSDCDDWLDKRRLALARVALGRASSSAE